MATVTFDYGTWSSSWGYTCRECGYTALYASVAVGHEEDIESNGGVCPDAPERDDEDGEVEA